MIKQKKEKYRIWIVILAVALIAILGLSLTWGHYYIPFGRLIEAIGNYGGKGADETVFWQSRLPRTAAAAVVGLALSVSGCAYQGVFQNPMVSPDLLGATAGSGFGAALGLYFGFSVWQLQLTAFLFGAAAVAVTCVLNGIVSGKVNRNKINLVLCGIVTSAMFQALISIIKYVADPYDTLPSIAFWLMGGLTYVTMDNFVFLLIPVFVGFIVLMLLKWRINILSFGNEEASAMGINPAILRGVVIICATMMTSAAVAVGGMIGWVGLVVPHIARMLVGADQKRLIPCASLLGAVFLLLVDDAARCLFAQDLPISILTALIGGPIFIILLYSGRREFL